MTLLWSSNVRTRNYYLLLICRADGTKTRSKYDAPTELECIDAQLLLLLICRADGTKIRSKYDAPTELECIDAQLLFYQYVVPMALK